MNARSICIAVAALLAACEAEHVDAVGQLASDRIELTAEFAEPLVERAVREGQRVAAGELVVVQDTARVDAHLRGAEAEVAEFEARLDELTRGPRQEQIAAARASVEGARRDVAFRRLEFERARDVFEQRLAAKDSVDRARAALDTAAAGLQAFEARLEELLNGTTVEELRQAEQRLAQATARLATARIDRDRHRLAAPVDGIVDSLPFETGERPQPGQPVAVLLAGTQPHARVYVPEALRARVSPGTAARIRVDGLARELTGRVRWVSADAAFTPYFALTAHDRGRLTYAAKVDLDYDGERLPDGVPVEVVFVTADE